MHLCGPARLSRLRQALSETCKKSTGPWATQESRARPGPKPGHGGRPREDERVLGARGSRLPAARKLEARNEQLFIRSQSRPPWKGRFTAADARRCIKTIPGYDPHRGAKDYEFDAKRAAEAVRWIHTNLTHVKGEMGRKPSPLVLNWEKAVLCNLFGWYHRKTGYRRYREVFIFVPRKNNKSTFLAALINYMGFCDPEPGAELYSAAATRDGARLILDICVGQIRNDNGLTDAARVYHNSIAYTGNDAMFRSLAAEAGTQHGLNPSFVVVDELHAQPNRELVDVLATAMGARTQPLMVFITTSDFEREGSICNEKHDYAGKVRDGIIKDHSFLPVIYEASIDDDWQDPAVWKKANPNLGRSVRTDWFRRECQRAQDVPAYLNAFLRLHLNIRTQQDVRAIPMATWDSCADPVDEDALAARTCYAGLDLASRSDIAAWVLLFPPTDDDPKYRVLPRFFMPHDNAVIRERKDGVPYLTWQRDGHINLTPGNVIDYDFIKQQILDDGETFNIVSIAADRWNLEYLRQKVAAEGIEMFGFGQGFVSMSEPTKELIEKLLPEGSLAHGGHPVLRWMANNLTVSEDPAGNWKPDKKKSSEKIDGLVALIMALGRSMVGGDDDGGGSVYDERGLLTL